MPMFLDIISCKSEMLYYRKSDHAVPYESIKRMLDRYQRNVTVDMLINTKR